MTAPKLAGTPAVSVRAARASDFEAWDRFVDEHEDGTFFHRSGWKRVIEEAFGHETHFLLAEDDVSHRVEGVVPLTHVKSRLFGSSLISTAFGVYGGALARTDETRRALEDASAKLAEELGVDYLEMRYRGSGRSDWHEKELYVTFRKPMSGDDDANMKAIPRKQRAMVRKGIQAGLVGEVDDDVSRFYEMYATSVRNLGTPVYPKRYFEALIDVFSEDSQVLTVVKDGRAVSSVLSFFFRDEVLPYYGGGTDEARAFKANDFMYWDVMQRAAARGSRVFDYGRSKLDTGSYRFKKNWGFTPEPLHYQYHLVRADSVPNVSPANPKYRLLVETWRRLPLTVSKIVGPMISGSLG